MEKNLFNKLCSKHKKGFTLFEVLIVVVILGVLATIAVPTYNKLIKKSRVSDGLKVLDMLSNAQDKYFIEHGHYAQSLIALNAPIKEYRTQDPSNPYTDIITTNFTYDKHYQRHCITAEARIGGNYTLVKNYKTKEKVVCIGADCNAFSDYVDEYTGQYADLCPIDPNIPPCQPPVEGCPDGTVWNAAICSCVSFGSICVDTCDPGTFNYTTWSNGEHCSNVEPGPEYSTGPTPNKFTMEYVLAEQKSKEGAGKGSGNNGGGNAQQEGCGIITYVRSCDWNEGTGGYCINETIHCYPKVCPQGYHLANTNYPGYNKCDCIKDCDLNVPHSVADICHMNTNPIEICNPCTNSSLVIPDINNRGGGSPSLNPDECCGYRAVNHAVECNYQTGEWQCVNNNPCTQVTGDVGENCDGHDIYPDATQGNTCGVKKFSQCKLNDSFSGADLITTCELKTGNACFEGQTRTCPNDPSLVQVCGNDCQWSACGVPSGCECDPAQQPQWPNPILEVPGGNGNECLMYKPTCIQNPDGTCQWDVNTNEIGYHPGANCLTGDKMWVNTGPGYPQRDIVDPENQCPGGKAQCECIRGCMQQPSNSQQEYCLGTCPGGPSCDFCNNGTGGGGGGGNGGGGIGGNCIPPAQGCGNRIWCEHPQVAPYECRCATWDECYGGGGGGGGGGSNSGYWRYCVDCKWTLCDPSGMHSGSSKKLCGDENTCGIKFTNKQQCDENTGVWSWIWDGTEICDTTGSGFGPKPTGPAPHYISPDECMRKNQEWKCGFSGWEPTPVGDWVSNGPSLSLDDPIPGGPYPNPPGGPGQFFHPHNCFKSGSYSYDQYGHLLPTGYWCEGCYKHHCPEDSVINDHDKKCYVPANDKFGLFLNDNEFINAWFAWNYECKTRIPANEHYIACRKDSNGNYFQDVTCPPPWQNSYYAHYSCIGESRSVISIDGSLLYDMKKYCKTTHNPKKVATSWNPPGGLTYGKTLSSTPPTWHTCSTFIPSITYYYCDPYPLSTDGDSIGTCDEVESLIDYSYDYNLPPL